MLPRNFGRLAAPLLAITTLVTVLLAAPSTSFACKCAPPSEVADALAQSSAVFEAQVTQLNTTDTELEVTLHVTRAWKGVETETIRVRTRKESGACGVEFGMGQVWLVYANQTTEDAGIALQVLRCGRSRLAEEGAEDLEKLGLGVVPVAPRDPAQQVADAGASKPATAAKPNQPQALNPDANGCASCSVGHESEANPTLGLLAVAALLCVRLARRRRS